MLHLKNQINLHDDYGEGLKFELKNIQAHETIIIYIE